MREDVDRVGVAGPGQVALEDGDRSRTCREGSLQHEGVVLEVGSVEGSDLDLVEPSVERQPRGWWGAGGHGPRVAQRKRCWARNLMDFCGVKYAFPRAPPLRHSGDSYFYLWILSA